MDMFCQLELQANFRGKKFCKREIQDDIWLLRLRLIAIPDSRAYRRVTLSNRNIKRASGSSQHHPTNTNSQFFFVLFPNTFHYYTVIHLVEVLRFVSFNINIL